MRERSLDEFESIFEQASIPVLDIEEVSLTRISAVLTGDPLDESILELGSYLKRRFGSELKIHWPTALDAGHVQKAARARGCGHATDPFASTAELVGQVSISRSHLLLLPEPASTPRVSAGSYQGHAAGVVDLDTLVQGTGPPVLIVRRTIADPAAVFRRILHSLTGNFQQTRNFAYSFTLAEDGGRLLLLHAIDEGEVQDVGEALQVAPDIADDTGRALLQTIAHHGERYLKAVAAAARELPFDVSYRLAVGEIVSTVREELTRGDYGLLVVGSHREGHSYVTADDYQLMRQVHDIPVLAL